MGTTSRVYWALALAVAAGVSAGCKSSDRNAADTAAARTDTAAGRVVAGADTAANRTAAAADTAARRADTATTRGGWTDGSAVAFARAANNGEVQVNQLAARKATNPAVKAFARDLVRDHTAELSAVRALATKLKVTPDTTKDAVRDLINHSRDEVKDLTNEKAGADWDKDYINKSIDDHKNVLDKLQDAAKNTTNPELRSALEKAAGKVQEHLTKAEDIKANKLKA